MEKDILYGNTYTSIPSFDEQISTDESIAVMDLETNKLVSYNLTKGWVDFTSKELVKDPKSISWCYIEELVFHEKDESGNYNFTRWNSSAN